jgi:hypothetical protein
MKEHRSSFERYSLQNAAFSEADTNANSSADADTGTDADSDDGCL